MCIKMLGNCRRLWNEDDGISTTVQRTEQQIYPKIDKSNALCLIPQVHIVWMSIDTRMNPLDTGSLATR